MTPDDLVDIASIKQLKYRYLRLLDLKDWDGLAQCFTVDATASYGGGTFEFDGREAIMDFLRETMGSSTVLTSHKVHHPEVEVTGASTASATWALDDLVLLEDFGVVVRGSAFYRDEYVRLDDGWQISHTGYQRVFEELIPNAEGRRLTASLWSTGGRSKLSAG